MIESNLKRFLIKWFNRDAHVCVTMMQIYRPVSCIVSHICHSDTLRRLPC